MSQNYPGQTGLVLAAGGGTRLGGGKLLLPWRGKPLVIHALEKLFQMPDLLSATCVLGHQASTMQAVMETALPANLPFPLHIVLNADWKAGLSTSLQCGIRAILNGPEARRVQSVLVLLADLPLVKKTTLRKLCGSHNEAYANNPKHAATAPTYQGRRGNPVVLSRSMFPFLFTLHGDVGARALLDSLGENLLLLPVEDNGILRDVDSPEDYASLP